jgi:hypothetical protein
MNDEEIKHGLEILIAFSEGKKLEFFNSGDWFDSTVSSLEQLKLNFFNTNMGKHYRIKQEPFKIIVGELYKFNDCNLDFKNRNECKKAFDEGKTIQYKVSGIWLDFSLDTLPKIVSVYTHPSFKLYAKLFGNNSNVNKSELRIKTVKLYSRRALYRYTDNSLKIITCPYTTCNYEIDHETLTGFVKWIEDKQEHNIEV